MLLATLALLTAGGGSSLLSVIVVLIVVGILMWLLNTKVTIIQPIYKQLINIVVIVAVVIWLLNVFGLFDSLSSVKTPHV